MELNSTAEPTKGATSDDSDNLKRWKQDPRLFFQQKSSVVRDGETVLLNFADGRQIFATCADATSVKISKHKYSTKGLIGLPFGTVLEVERNYLRPLPLGEDLIPTFNFEGNDPSDVDPEASLVDSTFPSLVRDNRHLVDNNQSQQLKCDDIAKLRQQGTTGSAIVQQMIAGSTTFSTKTDFSQQKYIVKKQLKYQMRCRIVSTSAISICQAYFTKDARKIYNLRTDSLAQILSTANIFAGSSCLIFETCLGVLTGAVTERLGGYGRCFSVYTGQSPAFLDLLSKFNFPFPHQQSLKWVHSSDAFAADTSLASVVVNRNTSTNSRGANGHALEDSSESDQEDVDLERQERERLCWPCPLQSHTRMFLRSMKTDNERDEFLLKRAARFARKLSRPTPIESKNMLHERLVDSLIVAAPRYSPIESLLRLFHHLAPSCPFVVFSDYLEPLTACFVEIQRRKIAINLHLTDTWTREYQILPGRTHPNMSMSQHGGYILTGIKLSPEYGYYEMDASLIVEMKKQLGPRRGRPNSDSTKRKSPGPDTKSDDNSSSGSHKRHRVQE
jgi:tRNA (adenine58-N1)-methyltransferase non-catalytic subunit